jgi:hypothetical protein
MKITKSFYDFGGRKYIEVDNQRIKVPWRYNRVLGCQVDGLVPLQSLPVGTEVEVVVEHRKWDDEVFLVLKKITPISNVC